MKLPVLKEHPEDALNRKLCGSCSMCCRYIVVPLKTPKTEDDFDHILWYILHENVYVWIAKRNKWYVRFNTKCKPLKDGRCGRYQTRPMLCREYSQDTCEKYQPGLDIVREFHTQEDLLAYLREKKIPFYGFYE